MAGISSFPAIFDTVQGAFGADQSFEAGADILAGQAVKLDSYGRLAVGTTPASEKIIGVALYDIPNGSIGAVRLLGVTVCANGDGSTAIAAGAAVMAGTLGGVVAATTGAILGIALEPIAGGATGKVLVCPGINTQA